MKVGFVFTNYNNSGLTENAVKSIQEFPNNSVKIIIVDNASEQKDRSALEKLSKLFDNTEVIFSESNVGYFSGLNIGINYLRKKFPEVDCMVVGNNDVLFPKDFLHKTFLQKKLLEQYPVISPNIITTDGFHQNPHVISKISRGRELIYDAYHYKFFFAKIITRLAKFTSSFTDRKDEDEHETAREIYQGYGACYILTPKFFELYKELWSPTFLMYEEFFLSEQLAQKGYKIYYEPSIRLTHLMHASTDKLPGKLKWKFSKDAHKEYRKYIKII